ncbi:MAG: GNAT family N-acetyltransferase [Cryomorphaceae bacterium]
MDKSPDLDIRLLPWDTDFFGFRVGAIHSEQVSVASLKLLKDQMNEQKLRLCYLTTNHQIDEALFSKIGLEYELVDVKTTYEKKIADHPRSSEVLESVHEKSLSKIDIDSLYRLALTSGEYSRFKIDQKIGYDKFVSLYHLWMENSLNRTIADDVLVHRVNGQIAGFVSFAIKDGIGSIGIIAVDENFRGMGIGKALLKNAEARMKSMELELLQVVTQGDNKKACAFYEGAGYYTVSQLPYYHIWMNQ